MFYLIYLSPKTDRVKPRTAATSKMELFVIIVNGWKPLIIITKSIILDVAAVLDPPLTDARNSMTVISCRDTKKKLL